MANDGANQQTDNQLSFSKKVWIAGAIISLIVIILLLIKTLLPVFLLILAGILIAIYFHGFANILKKYLHCPAKLSVVISVIVNLLLLVGFFWFGGARLQQQISELSNTLPQTIENAKNQMSQTTLGSKALQLLNSTGDSEKTMHVVKRFFSSGFGVLSDLYIVILLGLFFTASPSLYKKGIIALMPVKAKEKGKDLLNELAKVLKKWLEGEIIGFFFIAILTGIGLLIVGMPLVLTLALIAGLLNFIPNFGPLIALIPAVLLALMQGPTTAIIIACMYTFIQILQTSVTQPIIQKKMVNIPPALMIFGQVALGMLGGFWGVLLAVPVVAIMMTVINKLYVEKQKAA
jgi:predicted PurR-regulated permease PerM